MVGEITCGVVGLVYEPHHVRPVLPLVGDRAGDRGGERFGPATGEVRRVWVEYAVGSDVAAHVHGLTDTGQRRQRGIQRSIQRVGQGGVGDLIERPSCRGIPLAHHVLAVQRVDPAVHRLSPAG